MFEIFLASIIYWSSLLAVFVWLNKRLSSLKEKIADLEAEGGKEER
ncbi:MAG: hypothetical protein U9O85_02160 [Euryarchaeota archaeon]|nr:hypothetical protein [Euryarchaeota archaeon]